MTTMAEPTDELSECPYLTKFTCLLLEVTSRFDSSFGNQDGEHCDE